MANSFVRYTGNGSTDAYSVPFSYRAQADVSVTIDGVATTAYTWNGAGTVITFTSPPADTTSIEIRRTTSQAARLVDYADGSVLKENDLDTDSFQGFYMGQEAIDDANDRILLDAADFQWNAQSKRIKNVADPTAAQDAVTKNYVENTWLSVADKANVVIVGSNIASVNTVATNIADVITVANDLNEAVAEIDTVAGAIANVDLVGAAIANVNLVGGSIANVNLVGTDIANVNEVADNIGTVNAFGDRYRVTAGNPVSSLDVGDLNFNSSTDTMMVYGSAGWQNAGSSVNGTSSRFNYTATAAQTTFTGADIKGDTLAYDAGYVDVFLNGVRLSNSSAGSPTYTGDVTVTSGTSVVLATGASAGDLIDVVAYGTFNVASVAGSAIDSGTISAARMPKSIPAAWESKSNDFTAAAGKAYFCNTIGGAIDVTLPASPAQKDTIRFLDVAGTFDTNDLTILAGSHKIQGAAANLDVATERAGFEIIYYDATQGWLLTDK